MKKITMISFVLLLSSSLLFATDVVKSTTEITAYKKLVPTDTIVDNTVVDPPTISSFKIYQGTSSSSEVSTSGGKAYESNSIPNNYSTGFIAFYWEMGGNAYHEVDVSFKFGPLYSGDTGLSGNMNASDLSKIIPYTVTLSDEGYTRVKKSNNSYTNLTYSGAITYSNRNSASTNTTASASINGSSQSVTVYYSDNKTYEGNGQTVYSSAKTITFKGDLSTNSFAYLNYNNRNTDYSSYVSSCADWIRKGKATVTFPLNTLTGGSDGYYWIDTDNGRHDLSSGAYKANVVVIITSGS